MESVEFILTTFYQQRLACLFSGPPNKKHKAERDGAIK
jgi:hypothetical protein